MNPVTPSERQDLASQLGVNEQYLYQCMTARRDLDAAIARRLEVLSSGRIRVWHVRRDWHHIWPELVGTDGAPAVSEPAKA
jgi:hypothetical protein